MLGDVLFRTVRPPLWSLEHRLSELNACSIGRQLISPTPIMITYWADPAETAIFARAVNNSLATHVAAAGGRLAGLGTVPLQDVGAAVTELRRIVGELGLHGAEIGTQVAGRDLDDPELTPFFAAAAELDAVVFVHPLDGGHAAIRRRGQPYDFGLGMPTDTAVAATALICGGVLDRWPTLRIVLAHGCGTFAWAAPRIALAWRQAAPDGRSGRFDDLVRRLWVDTVVFDPDHLPLLVTRFGADHVMAGTDYPFIPGQLEGMRQLVQTGCSGDAAPVLRGNATRFLGSAQPIGARP